MKSKSLLICLAIALFANISVIASAQVNVRDSLALVDLYNSANGSNWYGNTNWLTAPVRKWYGITVTGTRVTEIHLNANKLNGIIPSSIGNLSQLTYLTLEALSNLKSPTAVNVDLLPGSNNARNFGSAATAWKNIYYRGNIYKGSKRLLYADSATNNLFAGLGAGPATTSGIWNTAYGNNSFVANTTGQANTANGFGTLQSNTEGDQNTAVGFGTLSANTFGSFNTAVGSSALISALGGYRNTAIGSFALELGAYGADNTAVGYSALLNNQANENSAFGVNALINNTSGTGNVAVGYYALDDNTTGSYNTSIGYDAGLPDNHDNTTTIGFGTGHSFFGFDNVVYVGNTSIVSIQGEVGFSQYSDGRIKDNIKQNVPGLAFINKLKPVTYHINIHRQNQMMKNKLDSLNWKGKYDIEKKLMTGFVAKDVEQAAKDVSYEFSGLKKPIADNDLYTLTYSDFIPPLVKAVQELSKSNNDKDAKINDLQKQIDELRTMITASAQSNASSQAVTNISLTVASLQQNSPNPFANATTISYVLPQKFSTAQIMISDKNGKTLRAINISGSGKGVVNVDAATLSSGTYNYSLMIDGKIIATKQMEHLK